MGRERDQEGERLRALEARVTALEQELGRERPEADGVRTGASETFWVLNGLRDRVDTDRGGLIYAGIHPSPDGPIEWQYGHTSEELLDLDADEAGDVADRLAALGSPVRFRLLQEVLGGVRTVADLAALDAMGTTGQIYHHVRILTSAGWLRSARRGSLQVPPARVVPLLLAIAAAR